MPARGSGRTSWQDTEGRPEGEPMHGERPFRSHLTRGGPPRLVVCGPNGVRRPDHDDNFESRTRRSSSRVDLETVSGLKPFGLEDSDQHIGSRRPSSTEVPVDRNSRTSVDYRSRDDRSQAREE